MDASGGPEGMGEQDGVSCATFRATIVRVDHTGRSIVGPCLGCDACFRETLVAVPRQLRVVRAAPE